MQAQKKQWKQNKATLLPEEAAPSRGTRRTAVAALFVLGLITVFASIAFRKSRRLRLHEACER